jgi:hypothetical protein
MVPIQDAVRGYALHGVPQPPQRPAVSK